MTQIPALIRYNTTSINTVPCSPSSPYLDIYSCYLLLLTSKLCSFVYLMPQTWIETAHNLFSKESSRDIYLSTKLAIGHKRWNIIWLPRRYNIHMNQVIMCYLACRTAKKWCQMSSSLSSNSSYDDADAQGSDSLFGRYCTCCQDRCCI